MTTTRETADHAELLEDALEALQIIDAFPSNQGEVEGRITEKGDRILAACTADIRACQATLLSEIAALRGERDHNWPAVERLDLETRLAEQADRATQAERQRDELRKALEPFAEAAESLDDETCDHDHIWEQPAAMLIDAGHLRTARALLANQGADQ